MRALLSIALTSVVVACGSRPIEPAQPAVAVIASSAAPAPTASAAPSKADAIVASIDANTKHLDDVARSLVATGDPAAIKAGAIKLVGVARAIEAPAWREAHREELAAADRASKLAPTDAQFAAQLDQYQGEELKRLLGALTIVGGDEVKAYLFELAARKEARREVREAAIGALAALVDESEPDFSRVVALEEEFTKLPADSRVEGGAVANAGAVVAGLGRAFRRCYNDEIKRDPNATAKFRVTAKIDANGAVASAKAAGTGSALLRACVEQVVAKAQFSAEGGSRTMVIPLTFADH